MISNNEKYLIICQIERDLADILRKVSVCQGEIEMLKADCQGVKPDNEPNEPNEPNTP